LSEELLKGNISKGDTVNIESEDGQLVVKRLEKTKS